MANVARLVVGYQTQRAQRRGGLQKIFWATKSTKGRKEKVESFGGGGTLRSLFTMNVHLKFLAGFVCVFSCVAAGADSPKTADAFFRDTTVWDMALTVSPESYAALEPEGGRRFDVDFEYVRAGVRIAGQVFEDAGLRYKGNSSFSTARGIPKKSFKIDFNKFVKGQKFLGLTKLNLNNNVLDPSQIREALAYRLWRKLGLPGSRTTFARVTLSVPGQFDKKLLGLYVVVEQVNGPYLKERFGTDKGLLLKPERSLAMPYLGEAFAEYERVYVPKSDAKPSLGKRLMAFTRLVSQADDAAFAEQIGGFVAFERLAKFTAAHAVLSHLDSFLLRGHNYYLYLPKAGGKFVFLPWDLNSTFASHSSAGRPEQQFDLSVKQPFADGQRLLERLMKLESFREPYEAALKELVATHFSKTLIERDMAELRKAVEPVVTEDEFSDLRQFMGNFEPVKAALREPADRGRGGVIRKPFLRDFVAKRHVSIAAQLAGEREGYVPSMRRRSGGRSERPTRRRPRRSEQ